VLVATVLFGVDLRGIRHKLPGVLHMRVCEKRVMRGAFVPSFRVGTCGEVVIVGRRAMMRCGVMVVIDATLGFRRDLRITHAL
jgi:hypothetical protein